MSSEKKAIQYLAYIQRYVLDRNYLKKMVIVNRHIAHSNKDEFDKAIKSYLKGVYGITNSNPGNDTKLEESFKELKKCFEIETPTPYEDPFFYGLLLRLEQEVLETAKRLNMKVPEKRPIIGTLPTNKVNAMVIPVPDCDEFLILYESEIFTFANLTSKVFAKAICFEGNSKGLLKFSPNIDKVRKNIDQNPEILERFHQLIIAYFFHRRTSSAPQYFLDNKYLVVADNLRHSFELFLMAHEFGHLICGHLNNSSKRVKYYWRYGINFNSNGKLEG